MEVVVTVGAIRCAKLRSNCHYQKSNTQLFTGTMPFLSPNKQCQRIEGKSITFHWLAHLKLTGGSFNVNLGAGFTGAKDDGSGGDNWHYKTCKVPVKSSPPTNQHPVFYGPDDLPVAQPTVSEHWRKGPQNEAIPQKFGNMTEINIMLMHFIMNFESIYPRTVHWDEAGLQDGRLLWEYQNSHHLACIAQPSQHFAPSHNCPA